MCIEEGNFVIDVYRRPKCQYHSDCKLFYLTINNSNKDQGLIIIISQNYPRVWQSVLFPVIQINWNFNHFFPGNVAHWFQSRNDQDY